MWPWLHLVPSLLKCLEITTEWIGKQAEYIQEQSYSRQLEGCSPSSEESAPRRSVPGATPETGHYKKGTFVHLLKRAELQTPKISPSGVPASPFLQRSICGCVLLLQLRNPTPIQSICFRLRFCNGALYTSCSATFRQL